MSKAKPGRWVQIQYDCHPYKKNRLGPRCTARATLWVCGEVTTICKTKRETLEEIHPADVFISRMVRASGSYTEATWSVPLGYKGSRKWMYSPCCCIIEWTRGLRDTVKISSNQAADSLGSYCPHHNLYLKHHWAAVFTEDYCSAPLSTGKFKLGALRAQPVGQLDYQRGQTNYP